VPNLQILPITTTGNGQITSGIFGEKTRQDLQRYFMKNLTTHLMKKKIHFHDFTRNFSVNRREATLNTVFARKNFSVKNTLAIT